MDAGLTRTERVVRGSSRPKPLRRPGVIWLERSALVCLLAAVVVLPLWLGGVTPGGVFVLRTLTGLGIACWLLSAGLAGRLELPPGPVSLFALGYLAISALSAAQSSYPYASQQALLDTLSYVGALFVAAALGRRYGSLFVTVLVVLAALLGVYGLAQSLGYGVTPQAFANRLSSTYYNSNHYAGFLDLVTPLCLVLSFQVRSWGAWVVFGLLTLLLAVNLALTLSWGVIAVGLVAAVAGAIWLGRRPRFALGAFVLAAVAVAGLFYSDLDQRVLSAYEVRSASFQGMTTTSLESRWRIGWGAWQVATDQPWLGVGPGNFRYAYPRYRAEQVDSAATALTHSMVEYAHNDYLHIASERGFVALGFYLLLLVSVLGYGVREARDDPHRLALAAAVSALLLHGLLDGNATIIPANTLLLWVCLGVLAAPEES